MARRRVTPVGGRIQPARRPQVARRPQPPRGAAEPKIVEARTRPAAPHGFERVHNSTSGSWSFQAGGVWGPVNVGTTTNVTERSAAAPASPPSPSTTKPQEPAQLEPRSGIAALVHFVAIAVVFAAFARIFHFIDMQGWDWLQVIITATALRLVFSASKKAIWGRPETIWTLVTLVAAIAGFLLGGKSFAGGDLIDYIANWMLWNF
ncbi:hypothetical protein GCM10010492_06760 [Saccharothrix mutabilis subsp. mutabilis]|uniref:Uncharacterized protein n=1 Tax=Saccharothrix mutabilis subsp. mutabilis TaxID=66855 RepID=A0ABN0T3Q1_9PSEU